MHPKRTAISTIARLTATGLLMAGIAVAPSVFHDLSQPTMGQQVAADESATTPATSPDVFHDL